MTQLFISYRNDDTYGVAHALHEYLAEAFGEEQLLLDVRTTRPGADFVAAVQQAVKGSDLLICLIGRQWLRIEDEHGRRMLDNPEDPVRVQLATALANDLPILPVLVRDAPMPSSNDLPDDLKPLARRQPFALSDRVAADLKQLLTAIERTAKKGKKDSDAEFAHQPPRPGETGPRPVLLPPVQTITPPRDAPIMEWQGLVNFEDAYPAQVRSILAVHKGDGDELLEQFLGEIGVEAALYHDAANLRHPLTLEVWLFDRVNLSASTLVIASPAANSDPMTLLRAARRGKIVPAAGDMRFAIETDGLYGEVGISQMQFSGDVANLYVKSAVVSFRVWSKGD